MGGSSRARAAARNDALNTGTCDDLGLRPPQVPLDVNKYPVAPQELELEQVHVFIRHGERAPVGVRLNGSPANIPEHWLMCKTGRQFRSAVAAYGLDTNSIPRQPLIGEGEYMPIKRYVERKDGSSTEGECLLGELTDIGRQSTTDYGRSLRDLYIKRLGFLPDTIQHYGEVYFRSTNMPRTMESLQHIIYGLYPPSKFEAGVTPRMFVRNGKDENLIGNTFACKRLEVLLVGFAQAAAVAYNPTLEPLDRNVSKYLGGCPLRIDGKPRASGVLDTVRASQAHGIKVPPEFEDKTIIATIEKAVVNEWFAGYKTEEVRRLGMGRLLDDVVRKMQKKVEQGKRDPLKLLVHSTHDTMLAAVCSTLDVFDEKWPPFTASVTFELFGKRPDPESSTYLQYIIGAVSPFTGKPRTSEHYIRMRYLNKNMVLPICAAEGKHLAGHPEFCTFEAFKERVKELTPSDWESACTPPSR